MYSMYMYLINSFYVHILKHVYVDYMYSFVNTTLELYINSEIIYMYVARYYMYMYSTVYGADKFSTCNKIYLI